ncbi:SDR family oxidoreductase [Microvirga sesbaniae]|uniref:SDR family oxidoreductase n=1 Tax=Microvirga sesbaniae TaxID=681392 RepID=UPI0021C941F2|nr:SDR family oxidoreductase [Microvirga sp. HBU67692]
MTMQVSKPMRVAIFGATSGIATAVARRYAESGARLVLVARDQASLTAAAADLEVRGAAEVEVQEADFARTADIPATVAAAWTRFDGLDLAVVAYGTLPDQQEMEAESAKAEQALVLNFLSPALLCGELAHRFEARKSGTLAVISSVAGDRGRKSNYVYGAAKGGLQRYLEGLRHRLFAAGVQVLDIRPGFVSTKMTAHLSQKGPLWASPDQVAADIVGAIQKRKEVLYTPWFWRWVMMGVRNAPGPLFHRTSL